MRAARHRDPVRRVSPLLLFLKRLSTNPLRLFAAALCQTVTSGALIGVADDDTLAVGLAFAVAHDEKAVP